MRTAQQDEYCFDLFMYEDLVLAAIEEHLSIRILKSSRDLNPVEANRRFVLGRCR